MLNQPSISSVSVIIILHAWIYVANQQRVPEARKMKPQGATRVHYKVKIVHILYLMAISNPQLAIDGNSNSLSTKKKEASSSKSLIKEKRQASKGDNNQMSLKSKL